MKFNAAMFTQFNDAERSAWIAACLALWKFRRPA